MCSEGKLSFRSSLKPWISNLLIRLLSIIIKVIINTLNVHIGQFFRISLLTPWMCNRGKLLLRSLRIPWKRSEGNFLIKIIIQTSKGKLLSIIFKVIINTLNVQWGQAKTMLLCSEVKCFLTTCLFPIRIHMTKTNTMTGQRQR